MPRQARTMWKPSVNPIWIRAGTSSEEEARTVGRCATSEMLAPARSRSRPDRIRCSRPRHMAEPGLSSPFRAPSNLDLMAIESTDAAAAGTVTLGGDLEVRRLGFGAMRLTGDGIWGPPDDHEEAKAVLRRAVDLGVDFIDTADAYGPNVSEELISEALHPYPGGLVIATKGGLTRSGPGRWERDGRPGHLRDACEGSLKRLRVERIDLYQLHAVDPEVPLEESVGTLAELRDEGKIGHLGLSNVDTEQLGRARE